MIVDLDQGKDTGIHITSAVIGLGIGVILGTTRLAVVERNQEAALLFQVCFKLQ